jgi:replicative DNA helicase
MNFPQSPEIEAAVIGQLLQKPDLLKKSGLKEADFEGAAFRRIYRAMEELFRKGQGFDITLLTEKLSKEDLVILDGAGSEVFSFENFPLHASRLKELSSKRSLQYLALEIIRGIDDRTLGESLIKARRGLSEILEGQGGDSITAAEMAAAGWKRTEERAKRRGELSGVPCGLKPLDDHLDGFQPCELSIIAARPGIGKTAFCLHCLLTAARVKVPGAFLSLEMGEGQIQDRLLSSLSGVPLWRIRKGILGDGEWDKITGAASILNGFPFRFIFGVRNLRDAISSMIRLVETEGARILFLDYLQLVKAEGAQNREREISLISGELKSLAVSLRVPIVALSQLSRAPEKREDRRPGLADLRDSGSLEQDADNVILLFREDINKPKGKVEFIVAKGRNTGGGTFQGVFDGETQRFEMVS